MCCVRLDFGLLNHVSLYHSLYHLQPHLRLLPSARCLLPAACCLLPAACCLLACRPGRSAQGGVGVVWAHEAQLRHQRLLFRSSLALPAPSDLLRQENPPDGSVAGARACAPARLAAGPSEIGGDYRCGANGCASAAAAAGEELYTLMAAARPDITSTRPASYCLLSVYADGGGATRYNQHGRAAVLSTPPNPADGEFAAAAAAAATARAAPG